MNAAGFVYLLTFANGKQYVGQTTKTVADRFAQHSMRASSCLKGVVYSAWRKHGKPTVRQLCECLLTDLDAREIAYIAEYGTKAPAGYNILDGGNSAPSLQPAVAAKISSALTGRKLSAYQRLRLHGRKQTQAEKLKRANSNRGQKRSDETKARMSTARKAAWARGVYAERVE